MTDEIAALEADLQAVIHRHSTISGREFQDCCLRMAAGYYSPADVDELCRPVDLARAISVALAALLDE